MKSENLTFLVPEYKKTYEKLSGLGIGYALGRETKQSKIGYIGEKSTEDRPRGLLLKRAEIYNKVIASKDNEERWGIN